MPKSSKALYIIVVEDMAIIPVSYTHLDVYKRQAISIIHIILPSGPAAGACRKNTVIKFINIPF